MKSEFKIEILHPNFEKMINKSYSNGRLVDKSNYLIIDDELSISQLKDLHNATIKVSNTENIDGYCRFIIQNIDDEIRIYPISMCVINENKKYIFF